METAKVTSTSLGSDIKLFRRRKNISFVVRFSRVGQVRLHGSFKTIVDLTF